MKLRGYKNWIIGVIVIALFLVSLCFFLNWSGNYSCDQQTNGMGFENRWLPWGGGCQICVNGSWVPLENYIVFN